MINHYQVGGSLSVDAPTYINRQADRELLTYLEQGDFCYVFNSRQMGKSSLLIRTKRFFYRVKYISLDNLNYACNWVKNYLQTNNECGSVTRTKAIMCKYL